MIVYKIDSNTHADVTAQITDMAKVLEEIYPTLEILKKLITKHEQSFSIPSIDSHRSSLQQMIANAMVLADAITENTEKLVKASEQASKHLASLDEHFSANLKGNSTNPGIQVEQRTKLQ